MEGFAESQEPSWGVQIYFTKKNIFEQRIDIFWETSYIYNIPNWTVLTYNAKFFQETSILWEKPYVKYVLSYVYFVLC